MKKKLVNLTIIVVGVGLIISLSRDIWRLLKSGERVTEAQQRVEQLEEENQRLQALKQDYQSEEYIESQARNRLNYAKEGETVVILPENLGELVDSQKPVEPEEIPNWQQWWNLFF